MKYFVSYQRDERGGSGQAFGSASIDRDKPVTCFEDVIGMQKALEKKHKKYMFVILNWRRFEESLNESGGR